MGSINIYVEEKRGRERDLQSAVCHTHKNNNSDNNNNSNNSNNNSNNSNNKNNSNNNNNNNNNNNPGDAPVWLSKYMV